MELMIKHSRDRPIPPSERTEIEVPPELDQIILNCLEKDPSRRPQSAQEVSQMLDFLGIAENWTVDRAMKWWELHVPAITGSEE